MALPVHSGAVDLVVMVALPVGRAGGRESHAVDPWQRPLARLLTCSRFLDLPPSRCWSTTFES